jgi:hydrogenase maturation factor
MQRKEIDDSLLERLRRAAVNGEQIEKNLLEKIFFRAFRRIRKVADELSKDYWDKEVIKEYFVNRHNMFIDDGLEEYAKVPGSMKELCKVHKAKVVGKKEDILIVEYGKKRRAVHSDFIPGAKIGDAVTIHYGYAVEKLG